MNLILCFMGIILAVLSSKRPLSYDVSVFFGAIAIAHKLKGADDGQFGDAASETQGLLYGCDADHVCLLEKEKAHPEVG